MSDLGSTEIGSGAKSPPKEEPRGDVGKSHTGDDIPHLLTRPENASSVTRAIPAAARHSPQPPATAEHVKEYEERFEKGREQRQAKLEAKSDKELRELAAGHNTIAQEILRERAQTAVEEAVDQPEASERQDISKFFDSDAPQEVKDSVEKMRQTYSDKMDDIAKDMAMQGFDKDDARNFLHGLYPEKKAEIDKILNSQEVGDAFGSGPAQKARAEEKEYTHDEVAAIERNPEAEQLATQAKDMYSNPERYSTDEGKAQKKQWLDDVGRVFGSKTGKTILKLVKITSIGIGSIFFIITLLMSIHTPKQ